MSPKKVKRAADAEAPSEPVFQNPNESWHLEVSTALDVIEGYFGADLAKKPALSQLEGFQSPLDFGLCHMRMTDENWDSPILTTGGCNALWVSPTFSMTPNVTINVKALKQFMVNYWPGGVVRPLFEPIDFRATMDNCVVARLSPEEPVQALVLQVAGRIQAGAGADEMEKWKKCLFSASGRLIKADSFDSQYFWAVNSRRRTGDAARSVVHLASQIVSDIWMFKRKKEAHFNKTFSAQEIAAMYAEHMADASQDEEPRSDVKVIERALTVYDKILSNPVVRSLIEKNEHHLGVKSPWNSINKLVEVHYKCRNMARVEFFFMATDLAMNLGQLEPGDLSISKLRGTSGTVGLLELVLMKKNMRDFFLTRFLDCRNFSSDTKVFLRQAFKDHLSYRAMLLEADRTFLSSWPESSSRALDLVEQTCFSWDRSDSNSIKVGIKAGKTAQEIVEEYNPWRSLIEEIDTALGLENAAPRIEEGEEEGSRELTRPTL